MSRLLVTAATAVALLLGCRKPTQPTSPTDDAPGSIAVQWIGAVQGAFAAPATAAWCPGDSLLEVAAVRGDSGFGFALLVADSVRVAQHPVVSPSVAVSGRPLAVAALRGVSDTSVRGFETTSGTIAVGEVTASRVSGTIDIRLKRTENLDTIRLRGTFDRVPIAPAVGQCGRTQRPAAPR